MKAIIMAGGQGTRLRPLTCNIPKPMMPILGKPTMEYAVDLLKKHGITDIGVTLQYLPDEVINYFGDGKEFGVSLKYFIEEHPLGTAGSVKNAENFLDESFVVISGDALTDIDLSKAIAYHKEKKSIATLLLKEVPVPLEYGVVVTDKDGRITGFLEKPSWSEVFSDKVNTGIYILEPEVFTYYEKNQKFDFSNDLFPILLNYQKPLYGFVTDGYWCDIGNIEQYIRCHYDALKGIVNLKAKSEKYRDGIWIGENCEIDPKANIIPPVYIGSNCKIYNDAEIGPYTVLGKNNILSNNTSIKRSILFDNCYVGSNSEMKGAVLSKKVQIESNVSLFEEAAVGDETLICERTVVKPGVSIWPNKIIEARTIVKSNIIWGGKFSKSIFGKNGISGEVNVDITPEFVSKLGSAYGSILKPNSKVAISCSDDGAAQMFKYSLATGLLSMGIEVYDLKRLVTPMVRKTATYFGMDGAIHVIIDKEGQDRVNILFFDKNGLNISKTIERKIENGFLREDFRRVKTDNFKKITHLNDCIEYYERQLVNELDRQNIISEKYRVVLSIRNPMLLSLIEGMFNDLRVQVKIYKDYKDILGLSKEVVFSGANFGVFISEEGNKIILIDEKGSIIKDEFYDALNSLLTIKSSKFSTLVVPVTASASCEQVAMMCGVQFYRTKTSQRSILDAYFKHEKKLSRREITEGYLMSLDPISVLMHTINFMAVSNCTLSSIISKIPRYYSSTMEIVCPWNMKGKVMRSLIEDSASKSVDLIEGVKLNFDKGWALILPDADEPMCRVYSESTISDEAVKISSKLAERIKLITGVNKEE